MPGLIHGLDPAKIAANLERVRERAGSGVEILAATKYVPLEEMGALAEAGVELVGENRGQELEAKHERWGDAFAWDFIGNLQSRKVKRLLPLCRLIHSVASESALEQLGRHGDAETEVLVEVNVAGEEGKGGIAPARAGRFHRPLPGARRRPDDDAAVQHRPGGLATAFRPPRRAGRGARPAPALDGHLAGLAGRGRGGGDDRPPRHRSLRPARNDRRLSDTFAEGFGFEEPKDARMALRDSWHKALVYFGLAEEHEHGLEYDDDFPETSEEEIEGPAGIGPGATPADLAPLAPRRDRRHLRRRRADLRHADPHAAPGRRATPTSRSTSSSRATSTTPSRSPTSSSARSR